MVMIDILQNEQKQSQNGTTLINIEWQPRIYGQEPPFFASRTQGKKVVIVNQATIQYIYSPCYQYADKAVFKNILSTTFCGIWNKIYNFLSVNEKYLLLWKQ